MTLLPYLGLLVAAILLSIGAIAWQRHSARMRREEWERKKLKEIAEVAEMRRKERE